MVSEPPLTTPPGGATLSPAAMREWRARLLHGEWRVWDLEFFHVLAAALNVATALLAAALVVATTRGDGNVGLSAAFVATLVAGLVFVRTALQAGLRTAERRTASAAATQARAELLDAVARGARLRPGAASALVSKGAPAAGDYLARAVPARAIALPVAIGVLALLAGIDPWSALIAGGVTLAAPVVLVALGRRAAAEAEAGLGRLRSLSARALELLSGAVELRALGAVARGRAELAAATDRVVASTRRSLRIGLSSATALDVLAGGAVGLVAMTDGFRLLAGTLGLGHAVAAVLLTVEVFVPLRAAGTSFHAAADGRAAIAVLDAVCRGTPARTIAPAPGRDASLPRGEVVVHEASLVPAPGAGVAVPRVSFTVAPGTALVVVGPTGSGKSTVLRAVAGQPLVVAGSVRVDGEDPSRIGPRELGAHVALVDQRPLLVAGTILENLSLGRPPADHDVLEDAVMRCGLLALLARAPRGLEEQVGEGGRLLSAGERTKLALARAVLRDPAVLLLDEVGAHLDDETLAELRRSMAGFLSSRTVLEAAHDRVLLDAAPTLDLAAVAALW